ncbi:hypothetical protein P9112_009926 [Eukaryota sp. TZLM1-RC]
MTSLKPIHLASTNDDSSDDDSSDDMVLRRSPLPRAYPSDSNTLNAVLTQSQLTPGELALQQERNKLSLTRGSYQLRPLRRRAANRDQITLPSWINNKPYTTQIALFCKRSLSNFKIYFARSLYLQHHKCLGLGLYAGENIPRHDFICPHKGETHYFSSVAEADQYCDLVDSSYCFVFPSTIKKGHYLVVDMGSTL